MDIRRVQESDYSAWLKLWHGYVEFYRASVSAEQTQLTWQRLLDDRSGLHGLVAVDDGVAIGFAHCFMHASTWAPTGYCYMEDLFVDPSVRGRGTARALIEASAEWAKFQGASKFYWLTQETNYPGRMLYDKLAVRSGFIHYERDL